MLEMTLWAYLEMFEFNSLNGFKQGGERRDHTFHNSDAQKVSEMARTDERAMNWCCGSRNGGMGIHLKGFLERNLEINWMLECDVKKVSGLSN